MFDEDGSFDPFVKFLLYAVLVLAAGKVLWEWVTGTVIRWITVDLWGAIAAHLWWTALIVLGFLAVPFLFARLAGAARRVGGSGDLGADAIATETEGLTIDTMPANLHPPAPQGTDIGDYV
ncbi:hypothetical protein AB0F25_17630 [Streptomyces wedmorensis]|uniref:hypothetical protein n=1 Tax=Streptomyces wedmorensis TaxID=43759 RepID=UPI00342F5FF2